MAKVFISYRRDDCPFVAHLLYERLVQALKPYNPEQVFLDVEHHDATQPFPDTLRQHLNECRVVLVVIGENWLTACDEAGRRRLDDPKDWVKIEVETALILRERIAVIPVLVGSASVPKEGRLPDELADLPECDAEHLIAGRDLRAQLDRLTNIVQRQVDGITLVSPYGIELRLIEPFFNGDGSTLRPFNLGIHPITQEQYCRVMAVDNLCRFNDAEDPDMRRPVESVNWRRAIDFCNKLSSQQGNPKYYHVQGQEVSIVKPIGNGFRLGLRI